MEKRYNKHGIFIFNDEVIYFTAIIKGKVILLLFTSLTVISWPIHFLRLPTQKIKHNNSFASFALNFKRNYKIKYKKILWNALCFSFAGHKHLCFNIRHYGKAPFLLVLSSAIGLYFKDWSIDLFLFVFPKITWYKNWVCRECWLN